MKVYVVMPGWNYKGEYADGMKVCATYDKAIAEKVAYESNPEFGGDYLEIHHVEFLE